MKQQKTIMRGRPSLGYVWVPKAKSWQVYQHFNSGVTDKIEWVSSEKEAKEKVAELLAPKTP